MKSAVLRTISAGGAAGALGLAVHRYATWEARQHTLRHVTVQVLVRAIRRPHLRPLRILHLSDLHLAPRDRDRMAWVEGLGQLRPHLTVVTGDFSGDVAGPSLALTALDPLLAGAGLFVRGSNDYFAPKRSNPLKYMGGPSSTDPRRRPIDTHVLNEGLTTAGWLDLNNQARLLEVSDWRIGARGVDDPHLGLDRYHDVAGPFPAHVDLRLGVAHAPYKRVLDRMERDGTQLILAGHTHGGQLRIPGIGALVTNCDLPRRRARGLSAWGRAHLHVSAGVGTNPFTPYRFACRPEATLLTIIAQ